MTRGRQAASSQATLVADEALHPIGKIQPQLIRCNPPNGVGSHRRCKRASTMTDDASARHGQPHRRRASATDAAGDNARDRAATNTFYPLTLMVRLGWSGESLHTAEKIVWAVLHSLVNPLSGALTRYCARQPRI